MKKLRLYRQQIWFALGLACIALTVVAFTFKPVAPSIQVFYGEEVITNNHPSFEIENGTDWQTFYGVATDNDDLDEVRTYTIRNNGDAPLTVQNISLENLADDFFTIVEEPTNSAIAIGDSASFKIGFTIRGYGVSAAKISLTTNDPVNPTFFMYLMANSIECSHCPSPRNINPGGKCEECAPGFADPPLCRGCANPKHQGEVCNQCLDKYNPDSYPSCNVCQTIYMVEDCTECVFPGQDITTYCNTCENPDMRWPRCFF